MPSGVVISVFILLLCVDSALACAGPVVGAIFGTIAVCCVIFGLIFFLCLKKGVIKRGKVFLISHPLVQLTYFYKRS